MLRTAGQRDGTVSAGTAAGVGAGMLWGLAFLIPEMVAGGSLELTLTRYLVYGAASVGLLLARWRHVRAWLTPPLWRAAFGFAVTGNVGYYLFVVLGIRLVGAPATVTIVGTLPVTVALVGNWRRRDFPFRLLTVPILLVLVGLLLVNGVELSSGVARPEASVAQRIVGIACALTALALWTSYGVGNAELLRNNTAINGADWSTVVGVATILVSLLLMPVILLTGAFDAGDPGALAAAAIVLGLFVSWGGTVLWNYASGRLPTAIIGLLVTVETVAGIVYVSLYTTAVPPALQLLGIGVVISGVVLGIRLPQRRGSDTGHPTDAPDTRREA